MPYFRYKARDTAGDLATGTIEADSLDAAGALLRQQGRFVLNLDPARDGQGEDEAAAAPAGRGGKVKRDQVITFSHQLSVMLDTGVPISEALECVRDQCDHAAFRAVLDDVTEQVQAGGELSAALSEHPKVFPTVMTSLVCAAEASGKLGSMLTVVSKYLSKEQATARKIRGAVTYPAVMLFMVVAVTIFLLVFVMPRFAKIYDAKEAALPLPTRLLMAVSNTLIHHWPLCVAGVVALIVAACIVPRLEGGRRAIDWLKLNSPVLGKLFTKLYLTRACRTMGTMIMAGVPILDMVAIVKTVTRNAFYETLWDDVDDRLRKGGQLSDALFAAPMIPRSVAQMIFAGEKSGRLGEVVEKIAAYTEEDFDDQVKSTTQYIEPVLVSVMGAIIGFVAIALLLPIFKIGTVMGS
jgi:type IV pilus assembly protein PilC